MSRYIDIEPYEKDGWYLQKTYYGTYGAGVKTTPLISIPTAELVVRCKDCKYYNQMDDVCPYVGEDGYYKELPGKDDFCSRGERKEGSDD